VQVNGERAYKKSFRNEIFELEPREVKIEALILMKWDQIKGIIEIKIKEEIKPRYNYQIKDPSETVNLVNTFESGSIAMVKSGKNKSSSTEFFFVTTKIPELDGRYSIFGRIIKGLDVLKKINKEDYIKAVQISN